MYELSVALKYLIPKWRQLSVSIISLISIIVIALVVWLIVVFFSVTNGLEKSWTHKLIALTAPLRLTPTEQYYNSYYYLVDTISSASDYNVKSITEKLLAKNTDPYDPEIDAEMPSTWPLPDRKPDGSMKDPVKIAFHAFQTLPGARAKEYEIAISHLTVFLKDNKKTENGQAVISQAVYLASADPLNPSLAKALLKPTVPELDWKNKKDPNFPLPHNLKQGDGVLLPKSYREAGVTLGDEGTLSYQTIGASSKQEQQMPIFVAGFYDPGILPMGGRFLLVNPSVVSLIRSAIPQEQSFSNGIYLHFTDLNKAEAYKATLENEFKAAGISPYWKIETYREYEFTKDLLQQLRSEKNLFTLISSVIIIVACSNIISMLIILVNDKKLEIGILRSMGATSGSIATIFGLCGIIMGTLGSAIGIIAALITLRNLQTLINFISNLQGFDAFNPLFYGESLPNEVSGEALVFVVIATALISLLAGVVPAIKACLMRPSAILRSE